MHFAGDAIPVSTAAREQSMSGVFCNGVVFSTASVGGSFIAFLTKTYASGFRGRWPAKNNHRLDRTPREPSDWQAVEGKKPEGGTTGGTTELTTDLLGQQSIGVCVCVCVCHLQPYLTYFCSFCTAPMACAYPEPWPTDTSEMRKMTPVVLHGTMV